MSSPGQSLIQAISRFRIRTWFSCADETPPEVRRFLIQGSRITSVLMCVLLLLLWIVQVASGREDPVRASLYCGVQFVVYGTTWWLLRSGRGERHSEVLAYVTATTLSMSALFAAWPSQAGINPYRQFGFFIPLVTPALSPVRPITALLLGVQIAAVYPLVYAFAPFDNMMSQPQAALVGLAMGLFGALAAKSQHYLQSELARARDGALEASRLKSAFLANLSHEIRTPMNAIMGFTEQLHDELSAEASSGAAKQAISAVHRNGERLLALLNDLVDLSQLESSRVSLTVRPCEVGDVVTRAAARHCAAADEKGLLLDASLDVGVPQYFTTDAVRLEQIFDLLLTSAMQRSQGGTIELRGAAAAEGGGLCFSIVDAGAPLAQSQLDHIFAPLQKGHRRSPPADEERGLGLALARQLAELLGGSLEAQMLPSAGNRFELRIPELPETPAPPGSDLCNATGGTKESATSSRHCMQGTRILVAEDGLDNQRLIRAMLRAEGAQVTLVENGALAVARVLELSEREEPYDLILMDMQMPELDGYEATRRLRRAGVCTPIIAVTAHAMDRDRERCISVGCSDYIPKPISRKALRETLGAYLKPS